MILGEVYFAFLRLADAFIQSNFKERSSLSLKVLYH